MRRLSRCNRFSSPRAGRAKIAAFSLPFMGRVVAQRPGGEGVAIETLRLTCQAAPTRLTLRVSHPPREGEGEAQRFGPVLIDACGFA